MNKLVNPVLFSAFVFIQLRSESFVSAYINVFIHNFGTLLGVLHQVTTQGAQAMFLYFFTKK
jgi:hypothetical protein